MRTLKQESIPFRIEGDYFLTGRESLSHPSGSNSLFLSPSQQPLQRNTRVSRIIVRDTSVANFVSGSRFSVGEYFFQAIFYLEEYREYFRAGI